MIKKSNSLDPSIEQYYSQGLEQDRLTQGIWKLEKERTLNILTRTLPPAPAVILDVGGAAGAYAFPLAERGYQVHLIDPVQLHIDQALEHSKTTKIRLASCALGDARKLNQEDNIADAVLLLGPLYHLIDRKDRLQALSETFRILKPNGILVAAAISRFASFMDGIYRGMLFDAAFQKIVENDLAIGEHRSSDQKYFTTAYFHRPNGLKEEVKESGFRDISLLAVEGPVWHEPSIENLYDDPKVLEKLHTLLQSIETDESIVGASAHMIAIGRK
jgi:ubiquinone/menaquinone biosynthesis C-methylase UbiE